MSSLREEADRMKQLPPHRNVVRLYGICVVGERYNHFEDRNSHCHEWLTTNRQNLVFHWLRRFVNEVIYNIGFDILFSQIHTLIGKGALSTLLYGEKRMTFSNERLSVMRLRKISVRSSKFYLSNSRLPSVLRWVFVICMRRISFIAISQVVCSCLIIFVLFLIISSSENSSKCVYRCWVHTESWRFRYVESGDRQQRRFANDR